MYRLPTVVPLRIGKDLMLQDSFKYCCICDRTKCSQPLFNMGVIDISNYPYYHQQILGIALPRFNHSFEGSYGDELVENLSFRQFQKRVQLN